MERREVSLNDSSDGHEYGLFYFKPFYALDARRSNGIRFLDGERIDPLYDLGEIVAEFNEQYKYYEAFHGWSAGLKNGWARRYSVGVAYEESDFEPTPDNPFPIDILPEDREFLYPFFGMQFVHDHYETTVNFDQISRTEDRHLGMNAGFRIGYSSANAGSSETAWHFSASLSNSLLNSKRSSLTINTVLNGRLAGGNAENTRLSAVSRFHRRVGERQLFYMSVSGVLGHDLDLDRPVELGGDTGLRGYPLRYQTGESKALITLEQRYYTDWYLFRILHVGAAVFFDVGRTWGETPINNVNLGWLKDVGFGLRLGKTRMGGGVVHIDLAFPLDGEDDIDSVQLLFKVKRSF